ncbi:MAG: hypothetical protein LBH76_08445, partial [Propionibacteriaceae bacterium]|nr:hypothetical protein [Propionibacteriaceae bacterium]
MTSPTAPEPSPDAPGPLPGARPGAGAAITAGARSETGAAAAPEAAPPGGLPAPAAPDYGLSPLVPADPTRVGDFWLDARLAATPSGVAYLAHEEGQAPVMVVLLSQGAADDPA